MRRNIILWLAASTAVMLALPWLVFILYAVVYLALGIAAMLISMFVRKKVQR